MPPGVAGRGRAAEGAAWTSTSLSPRTGRSGPVWRSWSGGPAAAAAWGRGGRAGGALPANGDSSVRGPVPIAGPAADRPALDAGGPRPGGRDGRRRTGLAGCRPVPRDHLPGRGVPGALVVAGRGARFAAGGFRARSVGRPAPAGAGGDRGPGRGQAPGRARLCELLLGEPSRVVRGQGVDEQRLGRSRD